MSKLRLYYATNRAHEGNNRWKPRSYGTKFSSDGMENLRFGSLTVEASRKDIDKHLKKSTGDDTGDGNKLEKLLSDCAEASCKIDAFEENLNRKKNDASQAKTRFGSTRLYKELRDVMDGGCDLLIYIHGFNVDWCSAVGSALALQCMLNRPGAARSASEIQVVLFSWPSDGQAMPFVSYKSDRSEAHGSGGAFGRGMLKLRDHLHSLRRPDCDQNLHLLCHSMGNYVLQSAVARLSDNTTGRTLPRIFDQVFMCAPDVDEDVLQSGGEMDNLQELCNSVSVYHNRGDMAMHISDYSKGNPDRLGHNGTSVPGMVHHKIHQVDCSPIVSGMVEHSYYQWGPVNTDIRQSIDGVAQQDSLRRRVKRGIHDNTWVMH